ncbi:Arm DNA-binding domain-containing protein [Variovorax sp.]|jgi:integrase|uniref:Arm DNA-binding domain-containing protein n=1 Tax=Variovorax sp. TaxID=1871043 RepID=UPI0040383333
MPVGITVIKRKNKEVIRVAFSFRGVQCRELLDMAPTKPNLRYAERLRAEIMNDIERGTFRYDERFPDSPRRKVFGHGVSNSKLLKDVLTEYKDRSKKVLQLSTWEGYRKAVDNVLIPAFGHLQVKALTAGVLREWISTKTVTRKRMSNLLLPLRNALTELVADEVLEFNPLDRLKLSKVLPRETAESDYEPDPYTVDELLLMFGALKAEERPAFQFWAYCGVRTSELVAITWLELQAPFAEVKIHRAVVEGEEKTTKTKAGIRTVPLLLAARQAAQAQRERAQLGAGRVFRNPRTGGEWTDQSLLRAWQKAASAAKVRYRNPYQLRHTFASQLLSQGENPAYISKLLGHKTTEMVIRTYGRFVDQGAALGFDRPPVRYGRECLPGLPAVDSLPDPRVKNV